MPKPVFKRAVAEQALRKLARRHHIRIHWISGRSWHDRAEATGTTQTVAIPKPRNARQLLVALHEFGHLLGSLPLADREGVVFVNRTDFGATIGAYGLMREAAAWAWAMENIPQELELTVTFKDAEAALGHGMTAHGWSLFTSLDHDS